MSFLRNGISKLRIAARTFLPDAVQTWIVSISCRLIQIQAFYRRDLVINHRNYEVYLSRNDLSGVEIYFFYLLHNIWKHETYEQWLTDCIINRLESCDFIDLGASYGMYTLLAASHQNILNIISVEASPKTYFTLKRTLDTNHLSSRVSLLNAAASSSSDDLFAVREFKNSEHNQVSSSARAQSGCIKSIAVDDLVSQLNTSGTVPLFIKMDIEGHEPDAFVGMDRLLRDRKYLFILFEFHIGLLRNLAHEFAEMLLSIPDTTLHLVNVQEKKLQVLDSSTIEELIDIAEEARHPHNLFNLLLVSKSAITFTQNICAPSTSSLVPATPAA